MRAKRTHADALIGIDLLQTTKLCFIGDQFSLETGTSFEHGFALSAYVKGRILTGKFAKRLFGILKIIVYLFQTLFEKNALKMSRRGIYLRENTVQLADV